MFKTIFGSNEVGSDQKVIGFGVEQVVLVRDEYLIEKVVNLVGKNALVLTIMESKGLEFQVIKTLMNLLFVLQILRWN